jgi:integrase
MKTLQEMIEDITDKKNSQTTYKSYLKKCFKILDKQPETYFNKNKTLDEYTTDTFKILSKIKESPPKTKQCIMEAWKSLLAIHDIELKPSIRKKINQRTRGRPISEEISLTIKSLKNILSSARTREKALFLVLATSGIRIGEVLKLRIDEHLELSNNPPLIRLTADIAEKGDKRITFITNEAKEYLLLWLKERPLYIKSKEQKCNFKIDMDLTKYEDRVFPFSRRVCELWWYKLLDDAGFTGKDKITNRRKTTIHQLRKFFKTQLSTVLTQDVIEALMGHANELQRAYRKYTEKQLAEEYLKGIDELNIFSFDTVSKKEFEDMKAQQDFYETRLRQVDNNIKLYEQKFQQIEKNLHIVLDPKNPETKDTLTLAKPYLIKVFENIIKRPLTKEELKEVDEGTVLVLNELNKLPTEKVIDLIKPENLPFLYDQFKKKKSDKN